MTGTKLAGLCRAQVGSGYVWGGLGYLLTEARLSQLIKLYPAHYTPAYQTKARQYMGQKVYDCVGLVKHFLWGNEGDGVLRRYGVNGIPDTTANGLLALCPEQGKMSALPENPGLLLQYDGHCGVYLGGGRVVEARGVDYGVVETALTGRGFVNWGKLPGVEYDETAPVRVEEYPLGQYAVRPVRVGGPSGGLRLPAEFAAAEAANLAGQTLAGVISGSPLNGNLPAGTVFENGVTIADGGNGYGFGADKSGATRFGRIYGDIAWADMISGRPGLIFQGEKLTFDESAQLFAQKQPRAAVAQKGENILFVTVDAPGMTMAALQNYLYDLGCAEAVALDGSAAIQLRDREGSGRFETVNTPPSQKPVYNVVAAYRKPRPIEPTVPAEPVTGKAIPLAELADRLRAEGIESLLL